MQPDCGKASARRASLPYGCLRCARASSDEIAILWIDDRPDTGLFQFLALDGFHITSVETGTAGLERAREDTFDLIVVDLHLPDMHGLTVLQRLRTNGLSTPALVVTGHYLDLETESHARAADATAFKYKPLWADEAAQFLRALAASNGSCAMCGMPCPVRSAGVPGSDSSLNEPNGGEMVIARLLATLDGLTWGTEASHGARRPDDALIGALLVAVADPALPLAAFQVCAGAVRASLHVTSSPDIAALAGNTRHLLRDAARHPLVARQFAVRKILSLLLARPRWWREEDLAMQVAASPSRVARLVSGDLGIEYRKLRRLIVMKAGVVEVLTSEDQFAQIAHRLAMHPGSFDAVFDETFGRCPRDVRRLWKRLHC